MVSLFQTSWLNDPVFNNLVFNATGLVCALTLECQNILNKRRNVPMGFQDAISSLTELSLLLSFANEASPDNCYRNLKEIKDLGEKKRQRSRPNTILFFLPDALRCVHYRAELQHCVDVFDVCALFHLRDLALTPITLDAVEDIYPFLGKHHHSRC